MPPRRTEPTPNPTRHLNCPRPSGIDPAGHDPDATDLLVRVYRLAAQVLVKLGEPQLARLAAATCGDADAVAELTDRAAELAAARVTRLAATIGLALT